MSNLLTTILGEALVGLLPRRASGALAFTREMPPMLAGRLASDTAGFNIPGWDILAVSTASDLAHRMATADQAVEARERVANRGLLLMVDPLGAGAGLDGVYSAGYELTQGRIITAASARIRQRAASEHRAFMEAALAAARQRAPRRQPSLDWRRLEFECAVATSPEAAGAHLADIGLWPVSHGVTLPTDRDIQNAEDLAFRMFAIQNARQTPEARVVALRLPEEQAELGRALAAFLRRHAGAPTADALVALKDDPRLWLGSLRPRVYTDIAEVDRIHLLQWMRSTTATYAWAGVRLVDGTLELVLPLENTGSGASPRLGVRWTTDPTELPRGSVKYRVEIRAGDEVLASRDVAHAHRSYQAATFTRTDFDDLDEGRILVCNAVVTVVGSADHLDAIDGNRSKRPLLQEESLDFKLRFGDATVPDAETGKRGGRIFPTMALAAASLDAVNGETFATLAQTGQADGIDAFGAVKDGFTTIVVGHRGARVDAPHAYVELARVWSQGHSGLPGRWRIQVRADGSPITGFEGAEFIPVECSDRDFTRASRAFAAWVNRPGGPAGALYHHDNTQEVKAYVEASERAFRGGAPELALVQTVEVMSMAKQTIGLIVLPTHPMRVAWQQAFDMLVWHARYVEQVASRDLDVLVAACAGSQYPAMLPGVGDIDTFVYGDTLGFHAVALVSAKDSEPKASIALLRRVLMGTETDRAASNETGVRGIASQIGKYLDLHPAYKQIRAHGLRSGDGMTLSRAIGAAVTRGTSDDLEDGGSDEGDLNVTIDLNLYPATIAKADLTGRHLSLTAERARKGGEGAVAEPDRWLLHGVPRPGVRDVPRLTWARRDSAIPQDEAHLAILFDVFDTCIETRDVSHLSGGRLELHGLFVSPVRTFSNEAGPTWVGHIPTRASGEPHPVSHSLTKRLLSLHGTLLESVRRGRTSSIVAPESATTLPVLVTQVANSTEATLDTVHQLADWVLTVDRNAGIEFYDSPRDDRLAGRHDTYVIDSVPERSDLGAVQLITSTARTEELQRLLTHALGAMNLTQSNRNAETLIRALKAVSGRLTMRLASGGTVAQELVALAAVQHQCVADQSGLWEKLSLKTGFFVPLDDVSELFGGRAALAGEYDGGSGSGMRSDLLHVTAGRTGELVLTLVEVKFRRTIRSARSVQTVAEIEAQLRASSERWARMFGEGVSNIQRTINRMRLARILSFYLEKGVRHSLSDVHARYIRREVDKLAFRDGGLPDALMVGKVGLVFCPQYVPASADRLVAGSDLWLFGAASLPDRTRTPESGSTGEDRTEVTARTEPEDPVDRGPNEANAGLLDAPTVAETSPRVPPTNMPAEVHAENRHEVGDRTDSGITVVGASTIAVKSDVVGAPRTADFDAPLTATLDGVVLGYREDGETPAVWRQDIRANPHLMIVGLPGMGKTSALLNICEQLLFQDIIPIVFSYHEDIDEKLNNLENRSPVFVNYEGLGFNPMRVSSNSPFAHIDNVGNLRDIFGAVFPDLGEIQLGKLREAILKSYTDRGWARNVQGETPPFAEFYETLAADPKPDRGLNLRLRELADYGLFEANDGESSLLDISDPVVIQIHKSPNDALQRAFSTFVLYSIYQQMFRRGLSDRITHAIIFDEAHRASRLKLIPTMAKECRKYGLSFILASQEARDFNESVFTAIANYLALRVNEDDARLLARQFADASQVRAYADRIKSMPKYHAYYFGEQAGRPTRARLIQGLRDIVH